jgi:hypothetical protein
LRCTNLLCFYLGTTTLDLLGHPIAQDYIPSDTFRGLNWQSPPTIEHTQNSTQRTGTHEEDFCAARSAAFLLYCIAFLYKQKDATHDALARQEHTARSAVCVPSHVHRSSKCVSRRHELHCSDPVYEISSNRDHSYLRMAHRQAWAHARSHTHTESLCLQQTMDPIQRVRLKVINQNDSHPCVQDTHIYKE